MRHSLAIVIWVFVLLGACSHAPAAAGPIPSLAPSPSATPSPRPAPTPTPSPTPTPDPYRAYTIDDLRSRSYGGGHLEIVRTLGSYSSFTRYLIRYPSDGLKIFGFMDVPAGQGPFPVIVALHGYIDPSVYQTLDYTTRYADALAEAGYLVIHPNLRGYSPSDDGGNVFRVGMAIDVLNLIAVVKADGGAPGALQAADPGRIGMWGHSMGGGIATRVLTVSGDVKAAVLYSPMSGDEAKNYAAIGTWSNGERGRPERSVPAGELQLISPMYYFDDIQAAVSINHSTADPLVPVQWSEATCSQMQALGRNVQCLYYPGMPHTFQGQGDVQFMQNTIQFFDRYLRAP
jgi:dipeptidyl aminopeptidase/acylaminoacyl peptidase